MPSFLHPRREKVSNKEKFFLFLKRTGLVNLQVPADKPDGYRELMNIKLKEKGPFVENSTVGVESSTSE